MFDVDDLKIKSRQGLDLTSMIDIIFILLIFFMVSTTFNKIGIAIDIPNSAHISDIKPKTLDIFINKEGTPYFEKEVLTQTSLVQLVQNSVQQNPDMVIVLNPDKQTSTQSFLDILDWCKDANATHFSIAAKKK